jgi:hypothetical protein
MRLFCWKLYRHKFELTINSFLHSFDERVEQIVQRAFSITHLHFPKVSEEYQGWLGKNRNTVTIFTYEPYTIFDEKYILIPSIDETLKLNSIITKDEFNV